jgi:hypothetical protein
LSATIEIRSNVACASSLGLVRKNSMAKFITRLLAGFWQVYHGKGGLGVDLIDRRLCRICKAANILLNLRRRHIDKGQRAMVGGRIANLEDSRRQNGQLAGFPRKRGHGSAARGCNRAQRPGHRDRVPATRIDLRSCALGIAMIGAVFTLQHLPSGRPQYQLPEKVTLGDS